MCCLTNITRAGKFIINRHVGLTPGPGKCEIKGLVEAIAAEDMLPCTWPPCLCILPWEKGWEFCVLVSYRHPPGS